MLQNHNYLFSVIYVFYKYNELIAVPRISIFLFMVAQKILSCADGGPLKSAVAMQAVHIWAECHTGTGQRFQFYKGLLSVPLQLDQLSPNDPFI